MISTGGYEFANCTFSLRGMLCKSLFSIRMRGIEFQRIGRGGGGKVEQEEVKRDISLKQ